MGFSMYVCRYLFKMTTNKNLNKFIMKGKYGGEAVSNEHGWRITLYAYTVDVDDIVYIIYFVRF